MAVSSNPALVEFPRDTWGFTTALRKYGLLVAGSIRGDTEKLSVFIQTLAILAQHAQARIDGDVAERNARLAAVQALNRKTAENINTETE